MTITFRSEFIPSAMRILLVLTLHCLTLSSAFDNFQGLGVLVRPCFPAFNHSKCKKTLEDSFTPPMKPASSNPITTKLFLFTPKSQDKAEQLHQCGGGLPPGTTFDPKCRTEVFIHGYTDGVCRTAWMREIKEQMYLRSSCYNVILVDWTWGNLPDLATASINARVAGQQVGYALKKIARQAKYDCKLFHIIGHSYGAAAGSYAGKAMQNDCRLGRLTALDDALMPFRYTPIPEYLNPTDALLVDTIHTNGGECYPFNVGNPRPLGHVNFYVNDGKFQPACFPYALISLLKLDIFYAGISFLIPSFCSHVQAIQYYKASILAYTDDTYLVGVQCDSYDDWIDNKCERDCTKEGNCSIMGLDTPSYIDYNDLSDDLNKTKIFYVPTTLTCPYADHSGFTGLPLTPINKLDPPV